MGGKSLKAAQPTETFPNGNPLYKKPQLSINWRHTSICLMWVIGSAAWEHCRIFTVSQTCLIDVSSTQTSTAKLQTWFPLQLCPTVMQIAAPSYGAVQKMAQKVMPELGSCTKLWAPIAPEGGQERWRSLLLGNCKPTHMWWRLQYWGI